MNQRIRMFTVTAGMVASLVLTMTACEGGSDADSDSKRSAQSNGSDASPSTKSTHRPSAGADAQRLPCRNQYVSNSELDECGLRFQSQTVVEATLKNPAKFYSELDSTDSLLNATPNCAAERCARPAPANTKVQLVCIEGDRFGIVAPQEHIIDQAHVTRYTTSMVGGKHVPGFEGKGTGVPIGFIDSSNIANLDKVSDELNGKLNDRFKSTSCTDSRIIVTDRMHRLGWNEYYSAKTPQSRD